MQQHARLRHSGVEHTRGCVILLCTLPHDAQPGRATSDAASLETSSSMPLARARRLLLSAVSPSSTASPAPSLTASKMESLTDVSSSKIRLAIGLYGQIVRKPLLFRHTTSRHGRARRAMTTASMATKLRTRTYGPLRSHEEIFDRNCIGYFFRHTTSIFTHDLRPGVPGRCLSKTCNPDAFAMVEPGRRCVKIGKPTPSDRPCDQYHLCEVWWPSTRWSWLGGRRRALPAAKFGNKDFT